MGSRSASLRARVVAVLVALAALWAFAAWETLRDGHTVLSVQTLDAKVAEPGEALRAELQRERRMSVAHLGRPSQEQAQALRVQRQRSEELAAAFTESARGWRARLASSDELARRIDDVAARLGSLGPVRDAVAGGSVDRAGAAGAFTAVLDSLFRVDTALGRLADERVAKDSGTLIQLVRVRELMAQEDALFAGVAAAGRANDREYAQFAHLVGAQRFLAAEALAELPAADRDRYLGMLQGQSFSRLRTLEDRLIRDGRPNGSLPVDAADWQAAVDAALDEQEAVMLASGSALVDRATPVAVWMIIRMVLAAGLGLVLVIASVVGAVTTARVLNRRLRELREAALRLEVFLSLARRTQAQVRRQLTLLDAMQRRVHDAEELEDLFRVDHLATRMRRNAENLIVLAGSTPGRAWRRHVPMVDVVRGAVAEVEDYTRVEVAPLGPITLAGRAVGDVIHLLAELIENGLTFSPPHTSVKVRGQQVADGFTIEVEDRGRGMTAAELTAANQRIVDRSELNLTNTSRLGLYVVSRLTERHGVQVRLTESPYGGVTAVVLIPGALVEVGEDRNASGAATVPARPVEKTVPPRTGRPDVPIGERTPPAAGDGARADPSALPVRPRRASTAGESARPTRARTGSDRGALNGHTVPIALPTARPVPPAANSAQVPADADAGAGGIGDRDGVASAGPRRALNDGPMTGAGLPVRVRQASIAPELRGGPVHDAPDPATDEQQPRPPEQVRQMMSAYQTGTRRGRADAVRLLGGSAPAEARTGGGPSPGDGSET
ncbi:histidine kinase [Micromonospora sp. KC606]|uniref:sensor histidine kinase n=1 Tax=Micromonospora sp. KC606 TaxID=2530379 RepID=UPI001050CB88|nr:nitrate- and nitrite sensing domain-containing protein [Micromonospora sp. KC606]TDC78293.1 histidine kinase [Micromonospora sp. KC606]